MPISVHSFRTLVTYGALKLPGSLRPADGKLFKWQDQGFDKAVACSLCEGRDQWLHAMPGQCLRSFSRARILGIRTVLNHASGPVSLQLECIKEEYTRVGLALSDHHSFDAEYFRREQEEYALAEYHCVASSFVKKQLVSLGIPHDRVFQVPYAADPMIFWRRQPHPSTKPFRILFAGQLTLRKGIRFLIDAYEQIADQIPCELHICGRLCCDFRDVLPTLLSKKGVHWHGALSQSALAQEMRSASVLVLPSVEEAFGLVVPQALSCGTPCVVSDRVGAADLIKQHENGSVTPVGAVDKLLEELLWWSSHERSFQHTSASWTDMAALLLRQTQEMQNRNA